eukprot:jgi/Pico_ML_1/55258/g143.t1
MCVRVRSFRRLECGVHVHFVGCQSLCKWSSRFPFRRAHVHSSFLDRLSLVFVPDPVLDRRGRVHLEEA